RQDVESLDIHISCRVPEADPDLLRKSFFYLDDVSLQAIEEPPLVVSTPLEEYYIGEKVPWKTSATSAPGLIKVQLLAGDHLIAEKAGTPEAGLLQSEFETGALTPAIYTLRVTGNAGTQEAHAAQHQIILTPNPFDWPTLSR
ncbi:MAG TPA: hypothetical protein VNT26_13065, partial [Candidatus Sulfotelmatobacter sp.]|nr:hypothetical protein [Candidatus Sulfotelmatobacter sp.]